MAITMTDKTRKKVNGKEIIILSLMILTFLVVAEISLGLISNIRINTGDEKVRSDKDLNCYWTINQTATVNVTWLKNGVVNSITTRACSSGTECSTASGNGTIPSSNIKRDEIWTCSISFDNGSGIETSNTSVTIEDTPPTQPRIFFSNGTEIVNITISMQEDSTTTLIVNSTDKDNDTISYMINDTVFCSINANTGSLSCSPAEESHLGTRTIRVAADTSFGATYQYLNINVTPTNDAPEFSPALSDKNFTEGLAFNYAITGVDDENNFPLNLEILDVEPDINLIVNRTSNNTFILMLENNRTVTYSEAKLNYNVTLRINDTDTVTYNNKSATSTFQLHGLTFNHLPNVSYIIYNNASLIQGGNLGIYINASDMDNDTITFNTNNALYPVTYNSSMDYDTITNSSFRYAWINVSGLGNNHVIYNNFSLYVFDTKQNTTQVISLSIINVNDAPIIHDISTNGNNTNNNTNLSSMIGYTGVPFRFKVNATDIDDGTYDYSSTGLGTYSTNDSSRFTINSTTGLLSFIPDSNTGNFTFIVTVTDKGGLAYNHTARIEVLPNFNPIFTKDNITVYCKEYDSVNWPYQCHYNISANVSDPNIGDYVAEYWTNSSIFTINSTTGIINFTAAQSIIGNYPIMLNITDSRGGMNSTIIRVEINNTNNAPVMQMPNVPSSNMIVGTPYQITYSASDLDLSLTGNNSYENLTFAYNIIGLTNNTNTSIFTLTKISSTTATLDITPINSSYEGNYSINITVVDQYGNSSSYHMTKYIYNVTAAPTILAVRPWGLPYASTVNDSWRSASDFSGQKTNISIYENETYTFNQTSIADNSSYPNHLEYQWYYDTSAIGNLSGTAQYYQKYFDFFSNGTHNMTLVATDQYGSSSAFTWIINVTNVNRPPTYTLGSIQNITVPGSGFITSYLTNNGTPPQSRFYDPDDDPSGLGYSTDDTTSLIFSSWTCEYANFSFTNHIFNIQANSIGECYIMFEATDSANSSISVSSEIILINITNVSETIPVEVPVEVETSGGGSSSQPVPIPLPEEIERPRPLQIVTPKLVTTYKNSTVQIPIVVNNTWNDTLIGITLEATTNASNVSIYMDRIYIPKLDKGEVVESTLYIKNYKSEGHYEIQISANVTIPTYIDTATIFINSAEMRSEGEELESKIAFARDLLSSNPECQELNELLVQAKKELDSENYDATAKIVDNVLNGCKYLVNSAKNNTETPDRNFIKTFEWKKSYSDYIILAIFGMLFLISLYYILKKDNPEQNF